MYLMAVAGIAPRGNLMPGFTHPAHEGTGKLRIGIGPQAVVHGYFEKQGGFRRTAEASGGAADGDARQLIAVFCCVIPGDKGAHAVPEKEIGKIRVFLSIYTSCFLILCLNT